MLTHIHIQNLTIIEQLTLDLAPGLSVITGETGAGKSIWVDAVQLALGVRADNNIIRTHAERGEITLCFDVSNISAAQDWLQQQDLTEDNSECIIRRLIERNSRSRCSINGRPVALSMLHEFSQLVLSIHSQHQQQTLLKEDGQQQQLDQFAQLAPLLAQSKQLFQQWQQLERQIVELQNKQGNRQAELELLHYQLEEINLFAPQENEWQHLSTQHQQLAHSEQSLQSLHQALDYLQTDDHHSATSQLQRAQQQLYPLNSSLNGIDSIRELLNQADIHLQEACDELRDLHSHIEINPKKLLQLEQRLSKMHDLARKHQAEPDELLTIQQQLSKKIADLTHADEKIAALQQQQTQLLTSYQHIATQLTQQRQQAAGVISQHVSASMQQLGMQGGCFKVELLEREVTIHPAGQEKVRFLVSTNPGQSLQPLQKIVSGGELSRIHLALQVMIANKAQTPTLIFDEVDVGIGGQTAAVVGKLLRQLAQHTQVLCITHLPQVAAYGQQHFQVSKQSNQQQTFSHITVLDHSARVEELARMLGGTHITAQTRAHAAELLSNQ